MSHSWCRDIPRDEAIRAAEDAAAAERAALPDHRDLPTAVAELRERVARLEAVIPKSVSVSNAEEPENKGGTMPDIDPGTGWRLLAEDEVIEQGDEWLTPPSYLNVWQATCYRGGGATPRRTGDTYRRRVEAKDTQPAPVPAADGLRAERVTPPSWQERKWDEALAVICDGGDWGRGNNFDHGVIGALVIWADGEMDRLAAERDAAIRERDAAREEAEKATALAKGLEEKRLYFRLDRDAAREECERLKARAAELESNANAATILAKIRESEWNVASALAAEANAELSSAPAANAGGVSNPEPISGAGKSRGSGNQEPVLYGVLWEGRPRVEAWDVRDTEEQAVRLAGTDGTVIPLCAAPVAESATTPPPRGWLTRHERWRLGEMVAWLQGRAAEHPDTIHGGLCESYAADIAALLARSSPPRVQLPPEIAGMYDAALVRNAIRAAGGEVE